jgi:hypothetical protein
MTIWRMRNACWITKATNTHSEYVIFIYFPLQQRLHERASVGRYTYIARLVISAGSGNFLAASTLRRTTVEQRRHTFHNLNAISFQPPLKTNCSRRTFVNYVRYVQICNRFSRVGNAIGCYSRAMLSRKGKRFTIGLYKNCEITLLLIIALQGCVV